MVVQQLVSPDHHWVLEGPLQTQAYEDVMSSFRDLADEMRVSGERSESPLSPPASVEGHVTAQIVNSIKNFDAARRTFESGAIRSPAADHVRYDLISPIALRKLAETYAEGALKYGDNNWLKGFPANDVLNHALNHLELWKSGDKSEPHLAHAMWNIATLIHFEETRPDLFEGMAYWKNHSGTHNGHDGIQCQSVREGLGETSDKVV